MFEAIAETFPHWAVTRARVYLFDRELRLGCTPDGFAIRPDCEGRGVIQAKIITRDAFRRRWLTDAEDAIEDGDAAVPIYYRLQTLTEMMLSEAQWGVVACIIATGEFGMTLRMFDVERDAELEATILAGVQRFWTEYYDRGIMPPFDPQRDERLVKLLYPRDQGTTLDLTTNNRVIELADTLVAKRAEGASADKIAKEAATEIRGILQGHTFGLLADGRVFSLKTYNTKGRVVEPGTQRRLSVLKQMPKQGDE